MQTEQESKAFLSFIARELDCDPEQIQLSTEFRSLPFWSSLNALLLVAALNEKTEVIIQSSQLAEWNTFNDFYLHIFKHWNGSFTK
jgi:acyl carrier protein